MNLRVLCVFSCLALPGIFVAWQGSAGYPGLCPPAVTAEKIIFQGPADSPLLIRETEYQAAGSGPLDWVPAGRELFVKNSGGLQPYQAQAMTNPAFPLVTRQTWQASSVWAWSCLVRPKAPLLFVVPASFLHRTDSLDKNDEPDSVRKHQGTLEYLWRQDGNQPRGYAPRPVIASWGTMSSQTEMGLWIWKQYMAESPSSLGLALARSVMASKASVLQRMAWLHQSLIQGAASLDPLLLPEGRRLGVNSSADYARDFLHLAKAAGLDLRLIIPLSSRQDLPLGTVGVKLVSGRNVRWYFPASRVFPPGRIPWYLDGLSALSIDAQGTVRKERLRARTDGSTSFTLRASVRRDASLAANISCQYEGVDASMIRADILDKGKQAVFFELSRGKTSSSLAVRHVLQLLMPVFLDATVSSRLSLREAESILNSAMRERFAQGRGGSWTDQLVLTIPAGSRIADIPRNWKQNKNGVQVSCVWKRIPGKAISKPAHWSARDWQRWLIDNLPLQSDTLIRERTVQVEGTRRARDVRGLIEDLEDRDLPVIAIYKGDRIS